MCKKEQTEEGVSNSGEKLGWGLNHIGREQQYQERPRLGRKISVGKKRTEKKING